MSTNEEVILDIVNAVGDHVLELDIRDSIQASTVSSRCSITHIATDGVYFSSARTVSYVVLAQASRQTIIVKCTTPGMYYLTNYPDNTLRPGLVDDEIRFSQNIITLTVTGTVLNTNAVQSLILSTIARPYYLNDLTGISSSFVSQWQVSVEQRMKN